MPRSAKCARDQFRRIRFQDHAVETFGAADGEGRAGFELFVQDRRGDAAGVAQKRPFDLRVLRIERGDVPQRIERADAEKRKIRAQRLDFGQSPASERRANLTDQRGPRSATA